jgi:hypothetical protein
MTILVRGDDDAVLDGEPNLDGGARRLRHLVQVLLDGFDASSGRQSDPNVNVGAEILDMIDDAVENVAPPLMPRDSALGSPNDPEAFRPDA